MSVSLSVIVPIYNAETHLESCLESIMSLEEVTHIILVDDGSSDGSRSIAERFARNEPRVSLYAHPPGRNRGPGAARNLGLRHVHSDLVAFLDADDVYLPGRFRADLPILASQSEIDGVYNAIGSRVLDVEGARRMSRAGLREGFLTTLREAVSPEELFFAMGPIGDRGWFHCDGLTVRRSLFRRTGLFDEDLLLSQDTLQWLKMALVGRLAPGDLDQGVALRGVHRSNRVNELGVTKLRPWLYLKLYSWMLGKPVSESHRGEVGGHLKYWLTADSSVPLAPWLLDLLAQTRVARRPMFLKAVLCCYLWLYRNRYRSVK